VLLYHRGLGAVGEMDAAVEEEAGFHAWMANHSNQDGASPRLDTLDVGTVPAGGSDAEDEPATIGEVSTRALDRALQAAMGALLSCRTSLQPHRCLLCTAMSGGCRMQLAMLHTHRTSWLANRIRLASAASQSTLVHTPAGSSEP
jgi:hypothetical protein